MATLISIPVIVVLLSFSNVGKAATGDSPDPTTSVIIQGHLGKPWEIGLGVILILLLVSTAVAIMILTVRQRRKRNMPDQSNTAQSHLTNQASSHRILRPSSPALHERHSAVTTPDFKLKPEA